MQYKIIISNNLASRSSYKAITYINLEAPYRKLYIILNTLSKKALQKNKHHLQHKKHYYFLNYFN